MLWLKTSTAASVLVGPVLDSAGAAYTGMAVGDFNLTKNGTTAAMAATATATHSHNGHYVIALTTGNTDTLGRLVVTCNKATYAMGPHQFTVLTATTFDAFVTNAAGGLNGLLLSGANNGATLGGEQAFNNTGTWTGNLAGSVTGNVAGTVASVSGAVGSVTAGVNLTQIAGVNVNTGTAQIGVNVVSVGGVAANPLDEDELKQLAADAMKLAPAAGDPDAGSVQKRIQDIGTGVAVSSIGNNVITANSIQAGAFTSATFAAGAISSTVAPNLDAAVSSRMATFVYTTPPTASAISTQVANDLAIAHGAGSWLTADVSGLLTTTAFTSSSVKVAGDRIILTLDASGVWSTEALANAPASGGGGNVIITPLLASAANPRYSTRKLATVPQGTGPTDLITLTDSTGAPVDLSGKDLRMVVAEVTDVGEEDNRFDDVLEGLYKYETGSGLTVQGDDDNQIKIDHDPANTADAGDFRYWIYDATDPDRLIPLVKGTLPVEPAVTDV